MKKHPTDLHLEALLDQDRDRQEILLHIIQCDRCRERVEDILRRLRARTPDASDAKQEPEPTADAGALPFALALLKERIDAPELLDELLRQPPARRETLLGSNSRLHTWGLSELLVEQSLETVTRDPWRAEELGALALVLSGYLDTGFYGAATIQDLRARAWAYVGNARRVRSDLAGAQKAFASSRVCLRRGTGSPFELAVILDLEGSLRRDQRLLDEAGDLFRQASRIFHEQGEPHRSGRSLVNLSTVHYFLGDLDQALALLRQSLDLLDMKREPRLRLYARHNLSSYLTEAGRFLEARDAYRETRQLYREHPEPWVQNRRKWVRGRILGGLGHPARAEALLLAARDGFLSEGTEGVPYDTALVSLEIALLYAEQGRTAELKRLAGEMVPIFSSLHIHREALAALAFLTSAIEAETASLEMVKAVADYLRRAANEPELRFQAPKTSRA